MKVLILDTYYPAFLQTFYGERSDLPQRPYEEQWRALMDQYFGIADYYSTNLQWLGHEATEIVPNCRPMQTQWAREHNFFVPYTLRRRRPFGIPVPWVEKDWLYPILLKQVEHHRPDVLSIQDPNGTDPAFVRQARQYVRLVTGQIASPVSPGADFSGYDLMLSSFPHFVERFRQQGLRSEYFRLGFEPRVLERLKRGERHDFVFVGGLSRSHSERTQFMEALAARQPLEWWGYGVENLEPQSPMRSRYHGPAWALGMYEHLASARIAINNHINVAERYANNMRLFEATGVGTLLLTDEKDNLKDLFEPGTEVVSYASLDECVELAQHYLQHEDERQAIAAAGQQRTLQEHTYGHRMQEMVELVQPLLN